MECPQVFSFSWDLPWPQKSLEASSPPPLGHNPRVCVPFHSSAGGWLLSGRKVRALWVISRALALLQRWLGPWILISVWGILMEILSNKNLRDYRTVGKTCQATLREEFLVLWHRDQGIGASTCKCTHVQKYTTHTTTQVCYIHTNTHSWTC